MATALSTNYGLTRVREMSPDAKDWAALDGNVETIGNIMKVLEQHTHTGVAAINYPGYNTITPSAPVLPIITEDTSGGFLTPGTTVGVRLSYITSTGLETDGAPETALAIGAASPRPIGPTFSGIAATTPGLSGGTYIYVITKKKATGESLPSETLAVTVPYDAEYEATIVFDAISTYTDGTTAINIYRATGLAAPFQLVTTITSGVATTYTDDGTILPGNQNIQPPVVNSFDAVRKVLIDWSALTHPAGAAQMRVYVTQQSGIWGNNCVLAEYDIGSAPNSIEYLGSESLGRGTPSNASQVPAAPGKLNLALEATGAPILTDDMDFAGFQAQNMVLHKTVSPITTDGTIYYDTSINTVRARVSGAWVNWGTTAASAYSHPAEESGGHIAANLKFVASGITLKTILDRFCNTTTGLQKRVLPFNSAIGTTLSPTTALTTAALLPQMTMSITSQFATQLLDVSFSGHFTGSVAGMTISCGIEVDGILRNSSIRSVTVPAINANVSLHSQDAYAIAGAAQSVTVRVLWWVDTGTATAVSEHRALRAVLVL